MPLFTFTNFCTFLDDVLSTSILDLILIGVRNSEIRTTALLDLQILGNKSAEFGLAHSSLFSIKKHCGNRLCNKNRN
jgi:hypothetical protein